MFSKAAMPIGLNTWRVVSLDCVDQFNLLRKRDTDLPHTLFQLVAAANLEVVTRLEKVNPAVTAS